MGDLRLPSGSVGDREVSNERPLLTDKMYHQYKRESTFGKLRTEVAATAEYDVHQFTDDGTVEEAYFRLNDVDDGGAVSVDFDLKKRVPGGAQASVLTGVVSFTGGESDDVLVNGTLDPTKVSCVAGTILTLHTIANTVTGSPSGPYGGVKLSEQSG